MSGSTGVFQRHDGRIRAYGENGVRLQRRRSARLAVATPPLRPCRYAGRDRGRAADHRH